MNTALHFSSVREDWQTPMDLWTRLHFEFDFHLDAAASAENALCEDWRGPDHPDNAKRNGLVFDWPTTGAVFVNPPYSRRLQTQFIAKAAEQRVRGVTTVMLIPARTDTRSWHTYIWNDETHQPREGVEIRFLRGRLKFVGAKHGAPFPSAIVVFRGDRGEGVTA